MSEPMTTLARNAEERWNFAKKIDREFNRNMLVLSLSSLSLFSLSLSLILSLSLSPSPSPPVPISLPNIHQDIAQLSRRLPMKK